MDELIDELQALSVQAPEFTPRPLKNPNNKWLVRSAFQKAIRRGQLDRALRMGEYMFDTDEGYAWQSLGVVAIEDVGFGALDLVALSTVTTLKTLRDHLETELLFPAMVQMACEAPKSRSCCELSLGAEKRSEIEGTDEWAWRAAFFDKDITDETLLLAMITDEPTHEALRCAYFATLAIRKRLRGLGEEALYPVLERIMGALPANSAAQRAAMMSFERTVDTMNLALFPILKWQELVKEPTMILEEAPTWVPEIVIKSVSSCAYDMHNLQGKKAIKAFWKSLKDDFPVFALLEDNAAIRAVGSLIFINEGGSVDRRIISPGLLWLWSYQNENFAIGYGCPAEHWKEMMKIVSKEIPRLNDMRKWAANL